MTVPHYVFMGKNNHGEINSEHNKNGDIIIVFVLCTWNTHLTAFDASIFHESRIANAEVGSRAGTIGTALGTMRKAAIWSVFIENVAASAGTLIRTDALSIQTGGLTIGDTFGTSRSGGEARLTLTDVWPNADSAVAASVKEKTIIKNEVACPRHQGFSLPCANWRADSICLHISGMARALFWSNAIAICTAITAFGNTFVVNTQTIAIIASALFWRGAVSIGAALTAGRNAELHGIWFEIVAFLAGTRVVRQTFTIAAADWTCRCTETSQVGGVFGIAFAHIGAEA